MQPHDLITAALFFALGWFGNQLRERRNNPRKRTRAIPKGTEPKKRPGRPRKAQEPSKEQPAFDFTIENGQVRMKDAEPRP
jgi:hypothetical protein